MSVTGQVASRSGGAPAGGSLARVGLGGLEERTVRAMEDIRAVPEPAGAGFEHIVRRKTYITGAADFNTARSAMERRSTSPVAGTGAVPGLVSSSARAAVDLIAALPGA